MVCYDVLCDDDDDDDESVINVWVDKYNQKASNWYRELHVLLWVNHKIQTYAVVGYFLYNFKQNISVLHDFCVALTIQVAHVTEPLKNGVTSPVLSTFPFTALLLLIVAW